MTPPYIRQSCSSRLGKNKNGNTRYVVCRMHIPKKYRYEIVSEKETTVFQKTTK